MAEKDEAARNLGKALNDADALKDAAALGKATREKDEKTAAEIIKRRRTYEE